MYARHAKFDSEAVCMFRFKTSQLLSTTVSCPTDSVEVAEAAEISIYAGVTDEAAKSSQE